MERNGLILMIIILALIVGCTKPYNPPPIKSVTGYLVVEGIIGAGTDSTKFRLSRTVSLTADSTVNPVNGASVTVQGNDNSSYPLTGGANGLYTSGALNINSAKQYRIDIKTADGNEYQSDYVPVKITPPIDTIMYAVESNGVQLTLNAHDPTNNTRYYRWDYGETWQFHAEYESAYVSNGDSVIVRTPAQQIYYCFANDSSTNILLGSSAKLSQDIITAQPITYIQSTSEKLETEYSIVVYQYALTNDAYNFWSELQTNTQNVGSIFDAQPSQLSSNIHCITNPNEVVVGYISASTRQAKRIFIHNSSLPPSWTATYPYQCGIDSILLKKVIGTLVINEENVYFNWLKGATKGVWVPLEAIYPPGSMVASGHTGTSAVCGDCTVRGSTGVPAFWKY
jgi:hypothetical protein